MSNPNPTDFRPKWYTTARPEDLVGLESEPWIGSQPLVFPRVTTRIIPLSGTAALSAKALSEIIENTQKVANYAAYDVVNGLNPEFADLRSMGQELLKFSLLTVEPFEEGSFVIPARFEAAALEAVGDRNRTVTTDEVAERFQEIFKALNTSAPSTGVSLGALQTVDALTRTLEKISADLEFTATNSYSEPFELVRTDAQYRARVQSVIRHRRPTSQCLETLEGRVTALDIVQGKLLLSMAGPEDRIRGAFPTTLHPKLMESLGRQVQLFGLIERRGGRPVRINIQDSETLDD